MEPTAEPMPEQTEAETADSRKGAAWQKLLNWKIRSKKVILVGVSEQDGDDAEDSVAELAELVRTAGAVVVGTLIQKRELMHPGTYVGTGKVAEIAAMIAERGATGIVCDDELLTGTA